MGYIIKHHYLLGAGAGPTRGVRIVAGFELQDQVKPAHLHISKLDPPFLSIPVSFSLFTTLKFLNLGSQS